MAERRMIAKTIIDSDAFLDMPVSTQNLYFHLNMRADDEGFINNPKKTQRIVGGSDDDLKLLIAKRFMIPFESGVVVIKHWKIHNYIRKDRLQETVYQDEKAMLGVKNNDSYTIKEQCQSHVSQLVDETPHRLGKVRLGKVRLGKDSIDKDIKHKYGEYKNVLLSDIDYSKLLNEFPNDYKERIEDLSAGIESKGYKYKSHLATIRVWAKKDKKSKGDFLTEIIKEGMRNESNGNSKDYEANPKPVQRLLQE